MIGYSPDEHDMQIAEPVVPELEIDDPAAYSGYFLSTPREISFYLEMMQKRGTLATAYLDRSATSFLTTVIAVDTERQQLILDAPQDAALRTSALQAGKITISAILDRVKIQFRINQLKPAPQPAQQDLVSPLP